MLCKLAGVILLGNTAFLEIIISYVQLKINNISAHRANSYSPFARSATSLGASPHHLPKATSFEATPQHRSFVPHAAMMFSLRSKWCCVCHANDVVPNGTNEKIQLFQVGFFWVRRRDLNLATSGFWARRATKLLYSAIYTPSFECLMIKSL